MKVVIVEDEKLSAERLKKYLLQYDPDTNILFVLNSVDGAIDWLRKNQDLVDLVFMDIQLSDRLCFEIFEHLDVKVPVIFTTAYDEYAVDAFKVNSIDYILKPVTYTDLSRALRKIDTLKAQLSGDGHYSQIINKLSLQKYRERFIIRLGNHLHSIKTEEIALFYADGRTLFLVTMQNKRSIIDFTLQDLEETLNPTRFFRINRTYIVNIDAIKDAIFYSNSRLKIKLVIPAEEDIIVSRDRVGRFKDWFGGM